MSTWEGVAGAVKSWGCTFRFQGGFLCCFIARKRRNRPSARFASRAARQVVAGWRQPQVAAMVTITKRKSAQP